MTNFIIEYYIPILVLLALIIFILGIYLGILSKKLSMQNARKQSLLEKESIASANAKEREHFLRESIDIISKSTLQGQCDLSESCIRLKKLLINFPDIESIEELKPIHDMYKEIEKFPYLEERKKLTKQERYSQDKERFLIEDRYREKVNKSLERLIVEINP